MRNFGTGGPAPDYWRWAAWLWIPLDRVAGGNSKNRKLRFNARRRELREVEAKIAGILWACEWVSKFPVYWTPESLAWGGREWWVSVRGVAVGDRAAGNCLEVVAAQFPNYMLERSGMEPFSVPLVLQGLQARGIQ